MTWRLQCNRRMQLAVYLQAGGHGPNGEVSERQTETSRQGIDEWAALLATSISEVVMALRKIKHRHLHGTEAAGLLGARGLCVALAQT